jgi:glutamine synthetase
MGLSLRQLAKSNAVSRKIRKASLPTNLQGRALKISQFFGSNTFSLKSNKAFNAKTQKEIDEVLEGKKPLNKEIAKEVADAVLNWALDNGTTHFCHWFQPLTGSTAEKHDSFLTFEGSRPIEKLSSSQLLQGEPDASSFPNGGTRSTFEARGYTCWDLTSPIFLKESRNGKTLCIPTAFVSYHGNALDVKTPLLRSMDVLSRNASKFLNTIGFSEVSSVNATCGCEQEYFLIDRDFYFQREDLVMTGRTMQGSLTARNQQLEDHYFGTIPERVIAYMQEVEIELYKLGIPAKTRHNEVAPGQFEIAPIFSEANIAADQNQILMATLKSVAEKHDFVCLFHEKPFEGVNGSGKHLNWSMSDNTGSNLLEPGDTPHENFRFLAMVAIVCEAVKRRSIALRAAIASHGNDHRLGANEAPPSIISVFLGDAITNILEKLIAGEAYSPEASSILETGTKALATLLRDNTDRNRTSPFAFTGNKFEFRAVGASANVGVPLTILNAAVSEVLAEATEFVESSNFETPEESLKALTHKFYKNSKDVVFNGDGYSDEWITLAKSRGLPNLRNSVDAINAAFDKKNHDFLINQSIYRETEFLTYLDVSLERYNKFREIEYRTQIGMVDKVIVPTVFNYLKSLEGINDSQTAGSLSKSIGTILDKTFLATRELEAGLEELESLNEKQIAPLLSEQFFKKSQKIFELCSKLENSTPDKDWPLPTYFDLLFVR